MVFGLRVMIRLFDRLCRLMLVVSLLIAWKPGYGEEVEGDAPVNGLSTTVL